MSAERHRVRLVTVAFVRSDDQLLLIRNPEESRRFAGLWNGIGGHVEAGEGVQAAARRELREEAGLDVPGLRLRVVIHESGLLGEAFVVFVFAGRSETRRLDPAPGHEVAWHPIGALDTLPLVHDVAELLPYVFADGDPVFLTEIYDGGDRRLSLVADEPQEAARAEGSSA